LIARIARHWGGLAIAAALWLILVIATLWGRPVTPVDETRVLSVAWEMWSRHDFLVPYLNGSPYSHKPPLYSWAIGLGWALLGVNEWWPRFIPPLFALGSVWLTRRLAQRLWPAQSDVADLAPIVLIGTLSFGAYSTGVMYDMMLVFFTLVGTLGLVHGWQRSTSFLGFVIFGLALGLGVLSKGPVIFLYLGIPAVLAPLWMTERRPAWTRWYLGVAVGVLIGVAIAASWAIPAALGGGERYAKAILWDQTVDRMESSFAHRQPLWWYLPLLPLVLFPWVAWPAQWRGLRRMMAAPPLDPGTRLMLLWSGVGLLAFSLISGKQIHYLLPLLPAFTLFAARAAGNLADPNPRDAWLPALFVLSTGAALLAVRFLGPRLGLPQWTEQIPLAPGLAITGVGVALVLITLDNVRLEAVKLAVATTFVVASLQAGLSSSVWSAYDLRAAAAWLKDLEARGVPVAHVGLYHGQFHFLGRLTKPLEIVPPERLAAWFASHPDGRAIVYLSADDPLLARAEFRQPFRSRALAIFDRQHYSGRPPER
jgi:4-amino-4-deoxy-L-arabinose transferase-like glycosyltransferase